MSNNAWIVILIIWIAFYFITYPLVDGFNPAEKMGWFVLVGMLYWMLLRTMNHESEISRYQDLWGG